ncbi:hypothetical protein L9G16_21285, partial [Shewanella sp. A25]|nr:hypothetical protein [Shewanella shenzhenensis]
SVTDLLRSNWYSDVFLPKMDTFQKGDLVVSEKQLRQDFEGWGRLALSINGKIYDITDYMATARRYPRGSVPNYHYLDEVVENFFKKYG